MSLSQTYLMPEGGGCGYIMAMLKPLFMDAENNYSRHSSNKAMWEIKCSRIKTNVPARAPMSQHEMHVSLIPFAVLDSSQYTFIWSWLLANMVCWVIKGLHINTHASRVGGNFGGVFITSCILSWILLARVWQPHDVCILSLRSHSNSNNTIRALGNKLGERSREPQ